MKFNVNLDLNEYIEDTIKQFEQNVSEHPDMTPELMNSFVQAAVGYYVGARGLDNVDEDDLVEISVVFHKLKDDWLNSQK